MSTNIVILSGQLLFAESIARQLCQHLRQVNLEIMHPNHPDTIIKLVAYQPTFIILDVTDIAVQRQCHLSELLLLLPMTKIIRLDSQQNRLQIVTGEQYPAVEVQDLVEVIEQSI